MEGAGEAWGTPGEVPGMVAPHLPALRPSAAAAPARSGRPRAQLALLHHPRARRERLPAPEEVWPGGESSSPSPSLPGAAGTPLPTPCQPQGRHQGCDKWPGQPRESTALSEVSLKQRKGKTTFLDISWFAVLNGRGDGSGRTTPARSCPHVLARPRHDPMVLGWHSVKCKESTLPSRDKH